MDEVQGRNILTINETVTRSKLEGIPVPETALRRWVRDGTLPAAFAGRKALIFWPMVDTILSELKRSRCFSSK